MKKRLYTTFYWGYKPLNEDDVIKMSEIERVFVIDLNSERDNFEYVMTIEPTSRPDGLNHEKIS